ncbi:MAG: hypothetical protein C0602_05260 [Denitrovibrio sp.]|nr:MAG: hypothetical protein C0602_05260 [Denitrovibrio sp.]
MGNGLLYLLLTVGMVSWGESWISAKVLTRFAEPEVLVFWRFFITWLTFIPVMFIMKKSFKINSKGLVAAIVGAVFLVLYNEMFFTGLIYGLAGAGGILVTTLIPLITFALGCVFTLKSPTLRDSAGLILGFIGAAVIMEVWHINMHLLFKSGNAYFLIAATTWALLTHTSKRANKYVSLYTFSFYLFMFTSVIIFVIIYAKGLTVAVPANTMFVSNIMLIAVGATTYGTTIYFIATNVLGSQKASSFIFLVPLNALVMSYLFLGEAIKINTVVGGLCAITAVYLINHKKRVKQIA